MKHDARANVSQFEKYLIVSYLTMIHIHDIDVDEFKILVRKLFFSQVSLSQFLDFLYNEANVEQVFLIEWQHVMDRKWLIDEFIPQMFRHKDRFEVYLAELRDDVSGRTTGQPSKKEPTTIEPFNLTKPRVRKLRPPNVLSVQFRARDVPESTFNADPIAENTLKKFREGILAAHLDPAIQQKNHEHVRKLHDEAQPLFRTLTDRMQTRTQQKREKQDLEEEDRQKQIIAEEEERIRKMTKDIEDVRKMLNQNIEIKINTATVLREDAMYRRQQQKEAELLKKFESGLRDTSEFDMWRREMEQKDEEERQLTIEQRKLEMKLTDERARIARQKYEEEVRIEVQKEKEEVEKQLKQVHRQIERLQQEKRERAESMNIELQKALEAAKNRLEEEKSKNAGQVRRERKKNRLRIAEQAEKELQKKQDLILQIRALENAPEIHVKQFDPTETSGFGLLSEMSYSELKMRLEIMKQKKEKEEYEKRREILEEKRKRESIIMEKARKISQYRQLAKRENARRRASQLKAKWDEKMANERERDTKLLQLQEKLARQREQRDAQKRELEESEKQRRRKIQSLQSDKLSLEKRRWEELRKGQERRERRALVEQEEKRERDSKIREKEQNVRETIKQREKLDKENVLREQEEKLEKKREEREKDDEEFSQRIQEVAEAVRGHNRQMMEMRREQLDPGKYGGVAMKLLEQEEKKETLDDEIFAPNSTN